LEGAVRRLLLSVHPLAALAWLLVAVAWLFIARAGRVEADETAVIDIVRNPNVYATRLLTVRGTMMNLRPDTPGSARPAGVIFDLVTGPALLVVRSIVPPPCQVGSSVTVDGRFVPVAPIRQQLYTNLIEATFATCR
jgi:hypothetical protein